MVGPRADRDGRCRVSILLIVEVMDWAPMTLTHREHKVLMILAEDCRDSTRETFRQIDSPDMLRRVRLTRHQMYAVIKALIGKKCLERSVAGGFGHRAKYKILPLVGLHSVGESPTQDEEPDEELCQVFPDTAVSGKTERSVGENGELCQEIPDAYPSTLQYPPRTSPVKVDLDLTGTGSNGPGQDQNRHQKEEDQDQSQDQVQDQDPRAEVIFPRCVLCARPVSPLRRAQSLHQFDDVLCSPCGELRADDPFIPRRVCA
jgi:hypothetical protein